MNGAETLVQSLVNSGVTVCFANPGTSEMHFVGALDGNPDIRCVLCLFEGIASGAADGYARMTGRPAATLLHLGPGLANAGANLHNAMRAGVPLVNIVGDHAVYHRHLDAPLTSNIEGLAQTWSVWVKTGRKSHAVASDAAEAVRQAREGRGIATLILPADTAWTEAQEPAPARPVLAPAVPEPERLALIERVLERGEPTLFLLAGAALADAAALDTMDRIAQKTGAEMLADTSYARLEAGAGRPRVEAIPYPVDEAVARLAHIRHCILIGAEAPVGFFAYPDKPGRLLPPECAIHVLAHPGEDAPAALDALSERLDCRDLAPRHAVRTAPVPIPDGPLTSAAIGASLANRMPDNTIVCDESLTTGGPILAALACAAPHSHLQLTGGAIGIGMPLSVGAAVACPDRKVITLQADGSGMYTPQALWTQARETLDVVTIVLSNRTYEILRHEMRNVGVENPGQKALSMTSLNDPSIDWPGLARSLGVPAERASTGAEFDRLLAEALSRPGPFLLEADLTAA